MRTLAALFAAILAVLPTAARSESQSIEAMPKSAEPLQIANAAKSGPSRMFDRDELARVASRAVKKTQEFGALERSLVASHHDKTVSNGLYFDGNYSFNRSGNTVSLAVDKINNDSYTRTTGTLRLELWATTSAPQRAQGFNGYRLAVSSTLSPLPPRTFYSSVTRTTNFAEPPAGTYWIVFVLSEFDSVNCSAGDHFCIQDTGVFPSQQSFGTVSNGLLTIISQAGDQCYENYPSAAYDIVQQATPGLFQSYPSTVTCASLGMGVYAGSLAIDNTIRVYTSSTSSVQYLCATGLLSNCTSTPGPSYTDLWWNPAEAGWGVSITHHPSGIIFLAWYTYDVNGISKWYVATNCPVINNACTGGLYETSGPSLAQPFNPALVSVRQVGSVTLHFNSQTVGTMSYNVNGITGTKVITRQTF